MADEVVKEFTSNTTVKNFTPKRKLLRFKIDDDVFEATPALPALLAMEFADNAQAFETADSHRRIELIQAIFDLVLEEKSATRFFERLSSKSDAIDIQTMFDVVDWLMGEYGGRPTESPASSSNGSETQESGSSLTVIAPVTELTSGASH
jgi:hypothetical protein